MSESNVPSENPGMDPECPLTTIQRDLERTGSKEAVMVRGYAGSTPGSIPDEGADRGGISESHAHVGNPEIHETRGWTQDVP